MKNPLGETGVLNPTAIKVTNSSVSLGAECSFYLLI